MNEENQLPNRSNLHQPWYTVITGMTNGHKPLMYKLSNVVMTNETFLIKQLSESREEAFVALYKEYQPKLSRFLYPFTGADDAKEIIQDIFLKIWEKRQALISIRSLEQYLYRMAKNRMLDLEKSRRAREKRELEVQEKHQGPSVVFQHTEYKEVFTHALKAIDELSERQRTIYRLRVFEDKSLDEISAQLALSKAVTIKQLYLATRYIRERLKRYRNEDHLVAIAMLLLMQSI